jgi:ADP-heptose:LPS heptosyltransferase
VKSWFASIPSWFLFLHPKVLRRQVVIVERYGGLGDVICLLPALPSLRQKHPHHRLIFLTSTPLAPLVRQSLLADAVLSGSTRGLSWLRSRAQTIQPLLPDEHSPAQPRERLHLIEEFARSLKVSGSALEHPRITPPESATRKIETWIKHSKLSDTAFAVIHTGPTWPVKQWPSEKWTALCAYLRTEHALEVIQLGLDGHHYDPTAPSPRVEMTHNGIGEFSILETLALISKARLFIGIDSGLLHLAAVARTPLVGLFGPTFADCFLPQSPTAHAVQPELPCIGCHHHSSGPLHWRTNCPHEILCMQTLDTPTVIKACTQALNSHRTQ